MRIVIFGATGATGQETIRQADAAGHLVTAFVRNPRKLTLSSPRLTVVQGSLSDPAAVRRAIDRQDAVISALGVRALRQHTTLSDGTRVILDELAGSSAPFLCVSSVGVADSYRQARTMGFLFYRVLMPFVLNAVFEDKTRQESVVRASRTRWLIVRPTTLTNGAQTGRYRVTDSSDMRVAGTIARADVAHYLLAALTSPDTPYGQAVTLSL